MNTALLKQISDEFEDLKHRRGCAQANDVRGIDRDLDKLCDLFGSLLTVVEEIPAKLERLEARHDRPGDFVSME